MTIVYCWKTGEFLLDYYINKEGSLVSTSVQKSFQHWVEALERMVLINSLSSRFVAIHEVPSETVDLVYSLG